MSEKMTRASLLRTEFNYIRFGLGLPVEQHKPDTKENDRRFPVMLDWKGRALLNRFRESGSNDRKAATAFIEAEVARVLAERVNAALAVAPATAATGEQA